MNTQKHALRVPFKVTSAACLALMTILAAGCGGSAKDPYNRVGYSGVVTLDGNPMKNGFLYLEPLEKQPTQSFASIQDGKFGVDRTGGAVPGKYKVAIVLDEATDLPEGVDPQTPEGAAIADKLSREAAKSKPLDASYNINSKLVAELKPDAPNEFVFDLQSKPAK
ncbi:hypothetical protein [Planctomicrobium piriforme]|uniref:Carboxypeptidase regulatory-like domain-containing protein n=1 Tax=Planctomicrobium piriforme TaxID=1576369 RepID=A0A1I3H1Z5_9PLAN|nr:hypothetical protein [Planctomicrobium piriforme]SFI29744.1 hypothetical protein SAMN05421753_107220 [Planctomicrobium piriforme]